MRFRFCRSNSCWRLEVASMVAPIAATLMPSSRITNNRPTIEDRKWRRRFIAAYSRFTEEAST